MGSGRVASGGNKVEGFYQHWQLVIISISVHLAAHAIIPRHSDPEIVPTQPLLGGV